MISFSILSSFLIWAAKTFAKSDLQITSPGFLSCDHLSLEAADRFGLVSGGQRSMYIRMNVFICTYVYKYVRRRELHGQMLVCMFIYIYVTVLFPFSFEIPHFSKFSLFNPINAACWKPQSARTGQKLAGSCGPCPHLHSRHRLGWDLNLTLFLLVFTASSSQGLRRCSCCSPYLCIHTYTDNIL